MFFLFITLSLLVSFFTSALALPQGTPGPAPPTAINNTRAACPTKAYRQFQPYLRTIGDPSTSPSRFYISEDNAGNRTEQVFTFSNIPPTAANLTLQWYVSEPPRTFTASGASTAELHLLDASILVVEHLTKEHVDNAASPTTTGQAAFDFWPDSPTQSTHVVSSKFIAPAPDISFRVRLLLGHAGDVVIEQNEQNGWLLKYDC
jgi:hypothetical protein